MQKTDELIKDLIGANEEVFQNAVIMTANNTIPFMAQKKIDKRKFIEGVLNLGVFGEMLLEIRSEYNEKKKETDLKGKDFINFQKNLNIFESQKQNFEENKKQKIEGIEFKIKETETALEKLQKADIPSNKEIEEIGRAHV